MASLIDIHAWAKTCIYAFPEIDGCDPEGQGLIALGGDLQPQTLIHAYLKGLFPWFSRDEAIAWWCPEPRCVMLPSAFVPSKSLRRRVSSANDWYISLNLAFDEVVHGCSLPRNYSDDTWIDGLMKRAYGELHALGVAFSLEVWAGRPKLDGDALGVNQAAKLIGGLYGLQMGRMVFGESMFYRQTDASKVAFWALNQLCRHTQVRLIDCQLENAHLMRLKAQQMPRREFLAALAQHTALNIDRPPDWQMLDFCVPVSWLLHADVVADGGLVDGTAAMKK